MSAPVICPICETANDPNAITCEVCGERLAPPQPGEVIPPEQNMAAQLQTEDAPVYQPPSNEAPPMEEAPVGGAGATFEIDDTHDDIALEPPLDQTYEQGYIEPAQSPIDPEETAMHTEDVLANDATMDEPRANVLYSHMTGEAYPEGTPEYNEGFGPMGEQLHPTPPVTPEDEQQYTPPESPELVAPDYDEQAAINTIETPTLEEPSFTDAPSEPIAVEATPYNPFPASGPNPNAQLPSPGTYQSPATLTLYFQKQPVLEHHIETDETLIGRKDIRADIHPDIDLTTWDHDAYVSRKHAYIYRQNKNYTLYAVSNSGLQLNNELLELGDRKPLKHGDIIVIAGILAMKFELPE